LAFRRAVCTAIDAIEEHFNVGTFATTWWDALAKSRLIRIQWQQIASWVGEERIFISRAIRSYHFPAGTWLDPNR
jgi:hypothetical protein